MTDARVGRLGVAVIGLLWLAGGVQAMVGGGVGSGEARSDVPFFEHAELVTASFFMLAAALLLGAVLLPPRRLAWVLAAWLAVQVVHFSYHLYDLETIRPDARLETMGGFGASLLVAAYLIFLLSRPVASESGGKAPSDSGRDARARWPGG